DHRHGPRHLHRAKLRGIAGGQRHRVRRAGGAAAESRRSSDLVSILHPSAAAGGIDGADVEYADDPPHAALTLSRAESREPKAESREPRTESREPKAESRKPRAESRQPRAVFMGMAPCSG